MSIFPTLRLAFVAAALALPASAQVQAFGGTAPRMAATRLFFAPGFALQGMVCVQYGQPTWKAEYDAKLDSMKGKQLRLGKDFWTTLNTSIPLTIGGTKVEPGSYYLGLSCAADGAWNLLVMKSATADKAGWGPFNAEPWKADFTAPMKLGASEKQVDLMTMDLNIDEKNPTAMTFVVSWGKHQLTVPVTATLAPAPAAPGAPAAK